MDRIKEVEQKLRAAKNLVQRLETEHTQLWVEALEQVKVIKNGKTLTLTFGNRVLKAKQLSDCYHWHVSESGREIMSEYPGGLNQLRCAIARGRI
jgi:hypothetical protein